jgi:hypothetical protein
MAQITMKELLEAGVHFGHQTKRWNPKMAKYIFGERNGIYIIDLQKTLKKFRDAQVFARDLAANGGTILFVGTKKQAQETIADEATRCSMVWPSMTTPALSDPIRELRPPARTAPRVLISRLNRRGRFPSAAPSSATDDRGAHTW